MAPAHPQSFPGVQLSNDKWKLNALSSWSMLTWGPGVSCYVAVAAAVHQPAHKAALATALELL